MWEYIVTAEQYNPDQQRIERVAQAASLSENDFPYTFPQEFNPGYYRGRIDAVLSSGLQTLSVGRLRALGSVGKSLLGMLGSLSCSLQVLIMNYIQFILG